MNSNYEIQVPLLSKSEIFKPLPDYETLYAVSNFGRVYSFKHKRLLKLSDEKGYGAKCSTNSYQRVSLNKEGICKWKNVHDLVMITFVGKRPDGYVVDHIDGNISNNRLDNLEYVTSRENVKRAFSKFRSIYRYKMFTPVKCIEDNFKFDSYAQASRYYHVDSSTIQNAIKRGTGFVKKIDKHFETLLVES